LDSERNAKSGLGRVLGADRRSEEGAAGEENGAEGRTGEVRLPVAGAVAAVLDEEIGEDTFDASVKLDAEVVGVLLQLS
jgi:hypothetical protein